MPMMLGPPDGIPGEVDILALEQALGFRLPEPYRTMLPRLNGAVPKQHAISISVQEGESSIQVFSLIENIAWEKTLLDSENPSDLLLVPFAIDSFGNSFCVVAAGGVEQGAIYFVDHEIAGDETLTRIADDLDQLMQRAEPDEIDLDAIRPVVISTWSRPGFNEWLKQRDERDAARRAERNRPGIPYTPSPPDDFPL